MAGPLTPPLTEATIGEAVQAAARRWPHAEALVSCEQGIRWTFAELAEEVDRLAAGLLELGLKKGERIGVWAPNCAEWALMQFAAARIGLILVTINPAYRSTELAYTLRKVGIAALVTAERFRSSDYPALIGDAIPGFLDTPGLLPTADFPDLRHMFVIGEARGPNALPFASIAAPLTDERRAAIEAVAATLDCRDPINIQFTSGTTGDPKGATLSHRNILNNGLLSGERMAIGEGDRLCIPIPLYHCFGLVLGNLVCLTRGATMVYPAPAFTPAATLAAISQERCTALHGVPTMFIAMLDLLTREAYDVSTLRAGMMAGALCPPDVMAAVIDRMNMVDLTIGYGMTETSPLCTQSTPDDTLERRVTTIGRVAPHVEIRIVDGDGTIVDRGETGEILIRGYNVMLGYWDDADRTAAAIDAEGWMHTGDLGMIDADGYGRVVGRSKDVIIRGGENVYPVEIENYLRTHPDILDAAVFAIPCPRMGEDVCAWVRPRDGAALTGDAVRDYCRGRIAHYKVPARVEIVDAFPMTVTGKIQKFEMQRVMAA
ncbi:AMP-binding protein [Sphingomonas naphthae]|uniref:AMP-binding protein n=2 Tax=Sphingomonas naphthae TaxID=1813468 RepID=A0ABY7TT30_9SPHN|nr:AMP-binding protein [Sphingomonas naphthae]WCT75374.1 AMP-binding protein [Sphingomonas naphthae]